MHDIRLLRDNPEAFDAGLARRGLPPQAAMLMKLDGERRTAIAGAQDLQQKRNELSKQVGEVKKKGGDAEALMRDVAAMKDELAKLEMSEAELGAELDDQLSRIPNLPAADVPNGKDEKDNVEVRRFGEAKPAGQNKEHFELGEALHLMDFDIAAKLSGARFTILKGALARLERALYNFMLDTHTGEYGYTEISPPLMVRDEILYGTGNLPKFADDLFRTTQGLWLIPTAEVPLTNFVNDQILDPDLLPLRYTAKTPCFRSEAGSAGRDTRGMLRQHQFYKVELVSITTPEQSNAEHERMTSAAESILKKLELPFRTMTLCTGDMGFASQKTYDIEVWLPGQKTYREISSCSNCGDFQARRMKARFRPKNDKNTQFVHTLNGSGIAVGRCLIAIMENYQQADGSIAIPAALQPYMGGLKMIQKVA
jgi:seryl-tRNA synthetase